MNIVDSSGWLEYFADGPNASFFSRPLAMTSDLVVPSITVYEVFKVVLPATQRIGRAPIRSAHATGFDCRPHGRYLNRGCKTEHRIPPADG